VNISDSAAKRLRKISRYIADMNNERIGYGPGPMLAVAETALSFARVWETLAGAQEVWADGSNYSLGGVMPGGIVFGMIATVQEPATFVHEFDDGSSITRDFDMGPITWTFHS
jgi:hypothetical protein